jgi:hypothetical protein
LREQSAENWKADVEAFCAAEEVGRDEFYNRISKVIAGRFYGNSMSYAVADSERSFLARRRRLVAVR